jgi:hypothetical protein
MSSEEKKPPVDPKNSIDDEEEGDLTEEELADVTAGAGAAHPRKVQEAATIEKKWAVTIKPTGEES